MMRRKESASRLAPPTSAPSISSWPSRSAAFVGLTLPPYWMRTDAATSLRRHDDPLAMEALIEALKAIRANGKTVPIVMVTTEAGHEEIELETTDSARPGHVVIPHGFGLVYEGRVYGANVNRLTKNTHRDPLAATPFHRYVPCRVTPICQ